MMKRCILGERRAMDEWKSSIEPENLLARGIIGYCYNYLAPFFQILNSMTPNEVYCEIE